VAINKSVKLPIVFRDPTPPPPDNKVGYRLIRDPTMPRLAMRITKAGARSWVILYHRSYTIGAVESWPYPDVVREAQRINQLIDQGGDPHADRDARRAAPTVDELIEEWRKDIDSKNPPKIRASSRREYETQIGQWISPVLGKQLVPDVKKADIEKLHHKITEKGTPVRANRVVALISTLFNFAIKKEMRADNPAKGVEKNAEEARYRLLSGEEFSRLLAAIGGCRYPHAPRVIRIALGTGARLGEILEMQWSQLDLAAGTWAKPPGSTKQRRLHVIPLAAPVRVILAEIQAEQEAWAARTSRPMPRWVFPAKGLRDQNGRARDEPIQQIHTSWRGVCKRAGIEDLHFHDLRHIFASYFASTGIGLPIIGRLLGNSQARTTERYSHIALDPIREQVERFGAFVTAVESGQSAEVVKHPNAKRAAS
jgi:integrase